MMFCLWYWTPPPALATCFTVDSPCLRYATLTSDQVLHQLPQSVASSYALCPSSCAGLCALWSGFCYGCWQVRLVFESKTRATNHIPRGPTQGESRHSDDFQKPGNRQSSRAIQGDEGSPSHRSAQGVWSKHGQIDSFACVGLVDAALETPMMLLRIISSHLFRDSLKRIDSSVSLSFSLDVFLVFVSIPSPVWHPACSAM